MTAFTATLAKCAHHRAVPLTAPGEEVDRCGELRIEMQLERRLAKLDQTIAQSHVSMLKWMFVYWTGTVLAMAALNSRSSSADANVARSGRH
jgi:hypothetical protein